MIFFVLNFNHPSSKPLRAVTGLILLQVSSSQTEREVKTSPAVLSDVCWFGVFRETICKILSDALAYCVRPSGGMADAGDLKSPARNGRVGSNPTSAITEDRKQSTENRRQRENSD